MGRDRHIKPAPTLKFPIVFYAFICLALISILSPFHRILGDTIQIKITLLKTKIG